MSRIVWRLRCCPDFPASFAACLTPSRPEPILLEPLVRDKPCGEIFCLCVFDVPLREIQTSAYDILCQATDFPRRRKDAKSISQISASFDS
jgi:hypothetical protein